MRVTFQMLLLKYYASWVHAPIENVTTYLFGIKDLKTNWREIFFGRLMGTYLIMCTVVWDYLKSWYRGERDHVSLLQHKFIYYDVAVGESEGTPRRIKKGYKCSCELE